MKDELLFAKKLDKIKAYARKHGNTVESERVRETFAELELNDSQLEMVYDYLKKSNIGVDEAPDFDEILSDKEKNYLDEYLEAIGALPIYSEGEKEALTISAMAGESDAIKRLTESYLPAVVDIAKLYTGQGVFLEDLIGEGNLALSFGCGMLGSLEKPSEADGMLGKLIMNAMEDYIAQNADDEKLDKRVLDRVNKVHAKAKELSEAFGRKVSIAELSEEYHMSEGFIRDAVRISGFKIEEIEG
ncbi:MAG: hypothetical protein IJ608_03975 [Lachnospiraceae bacterium]|nr:hypothetical protein [Lachnospiraceae bacterium]